MKDKLSLVDKALLVIEALTTEGAVFDLEFDVIQGRVKDKRLLKLNRVFTDIYKCAHVARKPSCNSSHKEWVKHLNQTYDAMHKDGQF